MNLRRLFLATLLALFAICPAMAGSKRGAAVGITFNMECDSNDNPKLIFSQLTSGKQVYYRKIPEFTMSDVEAFSPFPPKDGDGWGVVLKLKPGATMRLAALTQDNLGKWLLAQVNGRVVDAVTIDKQVQDGILVIWKGLGEGEIKELDKSLPRLGETKPRGK